MTDDSRSSTIRGGSNIASVESGSLKHHDEDVDEKAAGDTEAVQTPAPQQPSATPVKDPDLVSWDGPDDASNPQNFTKSRKWAITMVSALMTFSVSFGSSVFSTAVTVTAEKFHTSVEVMILGVTLYVVGFALGELLPMNIGIDHPTVPCSAESALTNRKVLWFSVH